MSSSTPNIGLTLPIGTEHVSRQIINDNMTKIDTAFGNMSRATMRDVPFAVAVADWTASGDDWVAEFATAYVTSTSKEFGFYDTASMTQYAKAVIDLTKKPGGGAIVFTTSKKPTGTITGTLYVWDSDDGKIPVIIENTVVPIENGGTNASNLSGAKQNLGIADCESDINTLSEAIANRVQYVDIVPDDAGPINITLPIGFTISNCIPVGIAILASSYWYFDNNPSNVFVRVGSYPELFYDSAQIGRTIRVYFMRIQ